MQITYRFLLLCFLITLGIFPPRFNFAFDLSFFFLPSIFIVPNLLKLQGLPSFKWKTISYIYFLAFIYQFFVSVYPLFFIESANVVELSFLYPCFRLIRDYSNISFILLLIIYARKSFFTQYHYLLFCSFTLSSNSLASLASASSPAIRGIISSAYSFSKFSDLN